jgi:CysZ protein
MYFFGQSANSFAEWLTTKTGLKSWLDAQSSGLLKFVFAFAGFILWLIQMLFYFSLFKYLWLILGSPLFVYLSEKTDSIINNTVYSFSRNQMLKDALRGMKLAARNAIWQTVYMIAITLCSLIPVAGWIMPLVAILVEGYYYGFSMLDYSFERRNFSLQESLYFAGKHKGLAIGNGLVFYLFHVIPIFGWVLAPAYAVVAATLSVNEFAGEQFEKKTIY